MKHSTYSNCEQVKGAVKQNGLALDILRNVCGLDDMVDDCNSGKKLERPCPHCGSNSSARILNPEEGVVFCHKACFDGKKTVDLIDAVMTFAHCGFPEALKKIVDYLERHGVNVDKCRTNTTNDATPVVSLAMDANGLTLEQSELTNQRKQDVKTTFYPHYNPESYFISTAQRVDYSDGSKACSWLRPEKNAANRMVVSPYVGGLSSNVPEPLDKDMITDAWRRVLEASTLYIVEGEKCADALMTALSETNYAAPVLTLGSCQASKEWARWARVIVRNAPKDATNKEVFVFGDNDDPGREAVKETARAFLEVNANVYTVDMATNPAEAPAGQGYDIADWLNDLDGDDPAAPFNRLLENATPYDRAAMIQEQNETAKRAALEKQWQRLSERDKEQAARAAYDVTNEELDESFPIDALPLNLRSPVEELAKKFYAPWCVPAVCALTIAGGFIGVSKARLYVNAHDGDSQTVNTLIHSCTVGKSGLGKTQIIQALLGPIERINNEIMVWRRKQKSRLRRLQKECNELEEKTPKDQNDNDRLDWLNAAISGLRTPAAKFYRPYKSPESSGEQCGWNEIYANARASEIEQKLQTDAPVNGLIIQRDDGSLFWDPGDKAGARYVGLMWAELCPLADGTYKGGAGVTRQDAVDVMHGAAAFLTSIQPALGSFLHFPGLIAQGFHNRFLWTRFPSSGTDNDADNSTLDISEPLKKWGKLIGALYEFQGAAFYCDPEYRKELTQWNRENRNAIGRANNHGDDKEAGYLGKQFHNVNALALILHLSELIEGGVVFEDSNPDVRKANAQKLGLLESPGVNTWQIVKVESFENAARLVKYFNQERRECWRWMERESAPKQTKNEPVDDTTDSLPPKYRKLHEEVLTKGAPVDLLKPDDQRGHALTVTELHNLCSWYHRNGNERALFENALEEAGLLFKETPPPGNKKGRRVFLPPFTLEQLEPLFGAPSSGELD